MRYACSSVILAFAFTTIDFGIADRKERVALYMLDHETESLRLRLPQCGEEVRNPNDFDRTAQENPLAPRVNRFSNRVQTLILIARRCRDGLHRY